MIRQSGQTLIELIVVMAVSVIIIGALVFATIASLRNAQFSKNQAQATKLAQQGLELVRAGRDQNKSIKNIPSANVDSWNGSTTNPTYSIWSYPVYSGCGSGAVGTACYLKLISTGGVLTGELNWISSSSSFPTSFAEDVNGQFKRAIIISDDSGTYSVQKTVTAIVQWTDFSGPHQSQLTTILRKI